MFYVEPANISSPEEAGIRLAFPVPPEPELLRLSPPLTARQPLDLYQDHRASNDYSALTPIAFSRSPGLGM
jgi:hypothetical protein